MQESKKVGTFHEAISLKTEEDTLTETVAKATLREPVAGQPYILTPEGEFFRVSSAEIRGRKEVKKEFPDDGDIVEFEVKKTRGRYNWARNVRLVV